MKPGNRLTRAYIQSYPADAARTLEKLPPGAVAQLLDQFGAVSAGLILSHMMPEAAAACLESCAERTAAELLESVPAAAAGRILNASDPEGSRSLLARMHPRDRAALGRLGQYSFESVGAHMHTAAFALPEDLTAGDALRRLRQRNDPADCEIYLVDRAYCLCGIVQISSLLRAAPGEELRVLLRPAPTALPARMSLGSAREHSAWETCRRLPVINDEQVLVGTISYKTLLEATRADRAAAEEYDAIDSVFAIAHMYWVALAATIDALLQPDLKSNGNSRPETRHAD